MNSLNSITETTTRLLRLLPLSCIFLALYSCTLEEISDVSYLSEDQQLKQSSLFELDVPEIRQLSKQSLPAYESQQELSLGKQDRFDIRGDFQTIYGETGSPMDTVRAIAEFEATESVLISWDWSLGRYLLSLIQVSATRAKVWILTSNSKESEQIREILLRLGVAPQNLGFFEFRHESVWTRDYGPWSVVDSAGLTSFVDVRYFRERRRDDAIPTLLSRYFNQPVYRPSLSIEGGNFMSDGAGKCFFPAVFWT